MKKWYFFILLFSMSASYISAQVSVNSDGSEADASAMLDVVSTTKGMLVPRMTTTQRTNISNAANGLLVFDETTASFWFYKTATGWEELTSGSSSVSEINDLSDGINNGLDLFMGTGSGGNNSGFNNNLGIGDYALNSNTSGAHNSALGYSALKDNTTGYWNVALGSNSQFNNTSGSSNISIGQNSLFYNSTGSNNIAIGKEAGYGSSGNNYTGNIFIGYQAGYNETGSNKLYIENSNSSTPLIGGDFSSNYVDINGRLNAKSYLYVTGPLYAYSTITATGSIIANSYLTANSLFTASSSVRITSGNPGSGKVLTSDASGYATWQTPAVPASMSLNDLTDAKTYSYSVYIGANSGNNSTANGNSTLGVYSQFHNSTGTNNTSIGYKALYYNNTGSNNTAIGYNAGAGTSAHSKSGNVFIGYFAGYYETGSNKLYIENSTSSTPLIGGDFNSKYVDINGNLNAKYSLYVTGPLYAYNTITASGSILANSNLTANSLFTANSTVKITSGNPGFGKVLTSDALGNATWQTPATPASMSLNDLTDAKTYSSSIYIGANSGNNSTATGNTTLGIFSQFYNSTGNNNTSIGNGALYYNIAGSSNTAIGYNAGAGTSNHSKSGNVFIGNYAGFYETGSNKLYIANSNTSSPLIGGDFSTNQVDINGTIKITGGSPGANKVLTSDADGNASWAETGIPVAMDLNDLSDASSDNVTSIFIGVASGTNDGGAGFNTAIGISSLHNNDLGISNTAIGYETLIDNLNGKFNLAVGSNALSKNTNGDDNIALGASTLLNNTTGSKNVAIGNFAGYGNSSSAASYGNIFIGYSAGYNETGDNKLYIENTDSSTPLIGGDFATDEVYINGTIKITGGSPGANKVLTSDADGNASWQNTGIPSAMSIDDLTEGNVAGTSIFVGTNAGANDDGTNNLNTSFGNETLKTNITGILNTAVGYGVLNASTSNNNTGIGYKALYYNTTGTGNTANGTYALLKNTTGDNNVGFGYYASYSNQTGDNNVAIGKDALKLNTASNNTAIGYEAGNDITNLTNTTSLGYFAIPTYNNQIVFGNSSVTRIGGYANYVTLSDKRFKNQIKENVAGLDFIMKLRPVTYHLDVHKLDQFLGVEEENPDEKSKREKEAIQYTGFIAQEVEQAAQEVNYDFSGLGKPQNEKDHYALAYAEFVVPLVKAVQEQQEQIVQQQQTIEQMQKELEMLKKLIQK